LIDFAERIEQDIPESCMFVKANTPEIFTASDSGRKVVDNGCNSEAASSNTELRWNGVAERRLTAVTLRAFLTKFSLAGSNSVLFQRFKQFEIGLLFRWLVVFSLRT